MHARTIFPSLLAVQAALGILMERRSTVATWAWLMVLILLPVVGLPLYLLFGRRQVKKKIRIGASATRRLTRALRPFDIPPLLTGARVDSADLTGANLTGAALDYVIWSATNTWSGTTCPDGSNSDTNGGTCIGFGI